MIWLENPRIYPESGERKFGSRFQAAGAVRKSPTTTPRHQYLALHLRLGPTMRVPINLNPLQIPTSARTHEKAWAFLSG